MAKIAIVVPVRSTEKHPSNPIATEQRFLNFGSLALATFCERRGHSSIVVDEYVLEPETGCADVIADFFGSTDFAVIGISCISAYSADRAKILAAELREKFPRAIIALGGQHFAGLWRHDFSNRIPHADVLIAGEAETATRQLLDLVDRGIEMDEWKPEQLPKNLFWKSNGTITNGNAAPTVASMDEIAVANYDLYPGSHGLFPSIEFSRGCKFACVFCANTSDIPQRVCHSERLSPKKALGV